MKMNTSHSMEDGEVECCVCLQAFEGEGQHVPRVLGCGHSLCHDCVEKLTIRADFQQQQQQQWFLLRCPECAHLTRLLSPHSLPNNIELLRLSRRPTAATPTPPAQAVASSSAVDEGTERRGYFVLESLNLFPGVGIDSCVIAKAAPVSNSSLVHGELIGSRGSSGLTNHYHVSLLQLGENAAGNRLEHHKVCYEASAQSIWQGLSQSCKRELRILSRLACVCHRMCRVLGFFLGERNKLYLVNKVSGQSTLTSHLNDKDEERSFVALQRRVNAGLNICEILMEFQCEGVIFGLFGMEKFQVDTFGHILLHWNGALHLRETMQRCATSQCAEVSDVQNQSWQYTSPEMLMALSGSGDCSEVEAGSGVWSLACFFLQLFYNVPVRTLPFMQAYDEIIVQQKKLLAQTQAASLFHEFLSESSLLEEHVRRFENLLWKGLAHEANQRPSIQEIWHHLKCLQLCLGSPGASDFNRIWSIPQPQVEAKPWCFGLEGIEAKRQSQECSTTSSSSQDTSEFVNARDPELEEITTLEGHADCITSLAICGKFLVSASFDKSVRVWSLQEGILLWFWEGQHSQRILAVTADQASQVCFTGDYGGAICAWKISEPFANEPLSTWQEHNDWRFTGVSALAVSTDGILYSGSGDRTIKAWRSKASYTLIAVLEGHRSLVSALVIDGELLYSGSWDGCIRIWWRSDHSPMAVLGSNGVGVVRALAVFPENSYVISSHDNGFIQVWENGKCYGSRKVHEGVVSALAVERAWLVTGSLDKSIKVWRMDDLLGGSAVASINCDSDIMSIVSGDRKLVISLSTTIKVFQL